MKTIKTLSSFKKKTISKSIAFSLLMIVNSQASALNVSLCAGETIKTMPDLTEIKVWGYGIEDGTANCASATVPGPQITVPVGDTDLNIALRNTLATPISVIIPGLKGTVGNTPVFFTDSTGRSRVRSLAAETLPTATGTYSFVAKAGTHMYQSGTHPAVQVQMGLYGASTQNSATGEAYSGVSYDNEIIMLYSEIDPAMHDAIAGTADGLTAATYGTANGPTSTIRYKARYFLVNGEPFTSGTAKITAGDVGQRTLIRFLNAGLESHAPILQGKHMDIVAEYGHAYPYARNQYSVLLAAGVTKDAIFTPSSSGDFALYDRRLRLSNSSAPGAGGLMSILSVAEPTPANPAAVAGADNDSTPEDTAKLVNVLVNDSNAIATSVQIAAQPTNGNAVVEASGDVTYTPNADFNGLDSFSYTVRNIDGAISNVAAVNVDVTPVNDTPVAADDTYDVTVNSSTSLDVQANDIDVDLEPLTTAITVLPSLGSALVNADGSITYNAGPVAGNDSLTYSVTDAAGTSSSATASVTVLDAVNEAPVAVDDLATVSRNTGTLANSVTVIVSSNDTDADGTLDLTTVTIETNPLNGSVTVDAGTGNITYTPRAGFRGSDAFSYTINDNDGATSNAATVRIEVLK